MFRKNFILISAIFISIVAVYGVYTLISNANAPIISLEGKQKIDPLNATYYFNNQPIKLINGRYENLVSLGSATKNQYFVWNNRLVFGSLNKDNINDAVMIIVNEGGGSGTFYYLATALSEDGLSKIEETNTLLLGDRIAIRDIVIDKEVIVVNYLDRGVDDPMSASPTIKMSLKFIVKNGILIRVPDINSDGQNCVKYGGEVRSLLCCQSTGNFPNTCIIGACGCSPVNSHEVEVCDCGEGKCYNGNECVKIKL